MPCLVPGCDSLRKTIGQTEDYVKAALIVFIPSSPDFLRMGEPVCLGMLASRFWPLFGGDNRVRWSELVSFVRMG